MPGRGVVVAGTVVIVAFGVNVDGGGGSDAWLQALSSSIPAVMTRVASINSFFIADLLEPGVSCCS
ncbi:MAG: hypothetical protein A2Z29_09240 [Chloroflexi bacterium RBG_16_56_11]|nr:MAG: hypothetical protein A2Z29_09240 [Chloroflexi bacterium RBG_16_56_11]